MAAGSGQNILLISIHTIIRDYSPFADVWVLLVFLYQTERREFRAIAGGITMKRCDCTCVVGLLLVLLLAVPESQAVSFLVSPECGPKEACDCSRESACSANEVRRHSVNQLRCQAQATAQAADCSRHNII